MSTIKADNIIWKSGESSGQPVSSVTMDKVILGTVKAWINYNAVTPAVRQSFNISSVTKNATGDYTETFTISFIDNSYVSNINAFKNGYYASGVSQYYNASYATGRTASTYRTYCAMTSTYTAQDPDAFDIIQNR